MVLGPGDRAAANTARPSPLRASVLREGVPSQHEQSVGILASEAQEGWAPCPGHVVAERPRWGLALACYLSAGRRENSVPNSGRGEEPSKWRKEGSCSKTLTRGQRQAQAGLAPVLSL